MSAGRFITFEGIEGAGKSTLARFAVSWLTARGVRVRATREPGGTPLAERVRQIVLERGAEQVSPLAETLLMFAARALHVQQVILPALASGEWVLCDRFTDATRAYQGAGRGVDARLIETLAQAVHPDLTPNATLLMDLPVEAGLRRARARSSGVDRFEAENVSFFERVRAGYLQLAAAQPGRIHLIDAQAALPVVEQQVERVLHALARP
jgi:dTMP kinase